MTQRNISNSDATFSQGSTSQSSSSTQQAQEQAREKVGQVADQAKQQAGQLTDQAKQQATSRLSSQKERASESLVSVAHALRHTGQRLREQDQGTVAQYSDQAADQIERFSGFLRTRDVNELVGEVERFARRQPALFLGGAFTLGLLGARFLKSSSDRARDTSYGSTSLAGQYTGGMPAMSGQYATSGQYAAPSVSVYPSDVDVTRTEQTSTYGTSTTSGQSSTYGVGTTPPVDRTPLGGTERYDDEDTGLGRSGTREGR